MKTNKKNEHCTPFEQNNMEIRESVYKPPTTPKKTIQHGQIVPIQAQTKITFFFTR